MSVDPQIISIVDRINGAWPYKLSSSAIVDYQDRLNGLDTKALNKTIDELLDILDERPTINKIKLAYDKHRPASKNQQPVLPSHPYDMARELVTRERPRVLAASKALFDQIPTDAGKAALRAYLYAAAWVMAQGVVSGQTSRSFGMTSDRIATGYLVWTAQGEDLREARNLFNRGRQLGRIEIEVPGRAMVWFKSQKDGVSAKSVKRIPREQGFNKEQRFG
ncbi:hypothetical protein [Rosistilla oblonga]|uniref:hypothetical protein n=1 Tax=Rosistilla oblonga TaxID=2527990 RepID=UPI003A98709F